MRLEKDSNQISCHMIHYRYSFDHSFWQHCQIFLQAEQCGSEVLWTFKIDKSSLIIKNHHIFQLWGRHINLSQVWENCVLFVCLSALLCLLLVLHYLRCLEMDTSFWQWWRDHVYIYIELVYIILWMLLYRNHHFYRDWLLPY